VKFSREHRQRHRGGSSDGLTVEDDHPSVATAGLGVVPEAHVVALHAGGLHVVAQVQLVATETGVARLHPCQLWSTDNKEEKK